jgi:hypothetical protein
MGEPTPDMLAAVDEILAELKAEDDAAKAALDRAQIKANKEAADDIDAHLPCRVEIVASETDADWETYGIDRGRTGWIRTPVHTRNVHGDPIACAYVEDMTPGDDSATRYHQPRHLRRLP